MRDKEIIQKIKKADLRGRGGAGFDTALKWEETIKVKADKKYLIINGSEGEPLVSKDEFILKHYPEKVIQGAKIAIKTIKAQQAYFCLREDFYQDLKNKFEKIITEQKLPITILKKEKGYLSGEETTLINFIQGNRLEPSSCPPYPCQKGLWGFPTLVNNVETLYCVAQIINNEYQEEKFYSLSGVKNPGVYQLSKNLTIKQILEKTKNWPDFDFFVQISGGASGEIFLKKELNQKIKGLGSIIVYQKKKTDPNLLMKKWVDFFYQENCGKCVPCREGVYRLKQALKQKKINYNLIKDLLLVLEKSSFCPFGKGVTKPFNSLINKVIKSNE